LLALSSASCRLSFSTFASTLLSSISSGITIQRPETCRVPSSLLSCVGQVCRALDPNNDSRRIRSFPIREPGKRRHHQRYPAENITVPIVLIHSDSDGLFELEPALQRLPRGSGSIRRFELKGYEHIDLVWGRDVQIDVIPRVLEVLP